MGFLEPAAGVSSVSFSTFICFTQPQGVSAAEVNIGSQADLLASKPLGIFATRNFSAKGSFLLAEPRASKSAIQAGDWVCAVCLGSQGNGKKDVVHCR